MPRLAANLGFLYQEWPFEERFAAAAADGFKGVEYPVPYAHEPAWLAGQLRAHGLQQVLFNAPAGGASRDAVRRAWEGGWRGTASLPGEQAAFRYGIDLALEYAQALDCPQIHVMSGINPGGSDRDRLLWLHNLAWAAERAAQQHVSLLIEAINHTDMPGYWLHTQQQAHAALIEIGHPGLGMQLDFYHCQMTEGDALAQLRHYWPGGLVRHTQIAGAPGRHEPDHGSLQWRELLAFLDAAGYQGWLGLEYRPRQGTRAGLGWLRQ
ncbi:hydroxypyruvate isomerase [Corticibacter populi]|uniref:Hydroxypyruvate isomerase n=1 Tax=Corticibacter populi TaxID=1550736 RepID=A0A3M6QU79_9BURK|nr:TIM barrel protein [Corticibacter populi]RMX06032.1 hydroxypyruvate isomerase [Corticibacter populi]